MVNLVSGRGGKRGSGRWSLGAVVVVTVAAFVAGVCGAEQLDKGLARTLHMYLGKNAELVGEVLRFLDSVPSNELDFTIALQYLKASRDRDGHVDSDIELGLMLKKTGVARAVLAKYLNDWHKLGHINARHEQPKIEAEMSCAYFKPKTVLKCCRKCRLNQKEEPEKFELFGGPKSELSRSTPRPRHIPHRRRGQGSRDSHSAQFWTHGVLNGYKRDILRIHKGQGLPAVFLKLYLAAIPVLPKEGRRTIAYERMLAMLASLGEPMSEKRFFLNPSLYGPVRLRENYFCSRRDAFVAFMARLARLITRHYSIYFPDTCDDDDHIQSCSRDPAETCKCGSTGKSYSQSYGALSRNNEVLGDSDDQGSFRSIINTEFPSLPRRPPPGGRGKRRP